MMLSNIEVWCNLLIPHLHLNLPPSKMSIQQLSSPSALPVSHCRPHDRRFWGRVSYPGKRKGDWWLWEGEHASPGAMQLSWTASASPWTTWWTWTTVRKQGQHSLISAAKPIWKWLFGHHGCILSAHPGNSPFASLVSLLLPRGAKQQWAQCCVCCFQN